jgi:hypothetical protein
MKRPLFIVRAFAPPREAIGFVLLVALSSGCFSSSTGIITGNVTYNGQPLEKGLITFSPIGSTGGTAGGEIAAGKFRVEKVVPATYQASVAAVPELKIIGPNDPEAKRTLSDAEIRAMIDPLPPNTTGKEQSIEVKGGLQTLDFKLESKSGR